MDVVDEFLTNRDAIFIEIRNKLIKAQEVMKTIADTKRIYVNFETEDWVMVKIQPYRQSIVSGPHSKTRQKVLWPI